MWLSIIFSSRNELRKASHEDYHKSIRGRHKFVPCPISEKKNFLAELPGQAGE